MSKHDRQNELTVIAWAGFLVVLIFFVGWTTIELSTEQRVSEHYARQAEASIRPEDVHLSCDGLAPDKITECVIEKYEKHEKWDKDRRDLHAQEDMALWAMWMLIFTALAFIAILGTLHYTRRAADYTKDTLKQAEATTKAAQDQLSAFERESDVRLAPFFHFQSVQVALVDAFRERRNIPWLQTEIKNTGGSAARDVILTCDYVGFDISNNTFDTVIDDNTDIGDEFGVDVPSGEVDVFSVRMGGGLSEPFVKAHSAGNLRIIFTLKYKHKDHRGQRQTFTRVRTHKSA